MPEAEHFVNYLFARVRPYLCRHARARAVVPAVVLRRRFFRILRPLWRVAIPAARRVSGLRAGHAGMVRARLGAVPAAWPASATVAPDQAGSAAGIRCSARVDRGDAGAAHARFGRGHRGGQGGLFSLS